MFSDPSGRPFFPGRIVKEFDWSIANDVALPAWLAAHGTSPILTYSSPAAGRGALRCQTKSATPTSGDAAGVQTAFNIDTAQFVEIAFIVYGVITDGAVTGLDHNTNIQLNNGASAGFFLQNNHATGGSTQFRVYPNPLSQVLAWNVSSVSAQRRKDLGVVIRPRTKEIFVCAGDPAEGAGVVGYEAGTWTDLTGQPLIARMITRTAAQRWLEFQRIKLRLVSN